MNIVFGQGCINAELGLGAGNPKGSTKPIRCETLDGIAILDIACGQNTTFCEFVGTSKSFSRMSPLTLLLSLLFSDIARNMGDKYSELPRFPEVIPSSDFCIGCEKDTGEDNPLLECEKCENPWHLGCLSPPLTEIPDGEWHCETCRAEGGEGEEDGKINPKRGRETSGGSKDSPRKKQK